MGYGWVYLYFQKLILLYHLRLLLRLGHIPSTICFKGFLTAPGKSDNVLGHDIANSECSTSKSKMILKYTLNPIRCY